MASNRKNFRKTNRGHYQKSFVPYPFEKHEEIELRIDGLTALGHGVGRINHTPKSGEPVENWVIFVPFALPGELVKIKITHNTKKNSMAEIVEILTASEHRVEAPCRHFGYCGGCQLQHLSYQKQLEYQCEHVASQLQKIAHISPTINPAMSTEQIWNYRSKITPHYSKPDLGKIPAIGFLHHSNKDQIIDLQSCAIAMQPLNEVLPKLKEATRGRARAIKEKGSLLMRVNEDTVETHEANVVSEKVGDLTFHFLAGDFFQNNPFILPCFTDYVGKQAKLKGARYLVDAYCGCGLFALTLAKQFEKVLGVEISATSADWARYNAEFNDIENTQFLTASAEHIFKQVDFPAEETSVVIDPPRAGCNQELLTQLFELAPHTVVYVSCDPSTQIRDLTHFIEAGYTVVDVQPFDLFPHTRHLECVVTLTK